MYTHPYFNAFRRRTKSANLKLPLARIEQWSINRETRFIRLDSETIFVGVDQGIVQARSEDDFHLLWETSIAPPEHLARSPLVCRNWVLANHGKSLFVIRREDGNIERTRTFQGAIAIDDSLCVGNICVVSATVWKGDHFLYGFEIDHGRVRWTLSHEHLSACLTAIEDSTYFAVDDGPGQLSCYDIYTGQLQWRTDLRSFNLEERFGLDAEAVESIDRIRHVSNWNDLLIVDFGPDCLAALDASTGQLRWIQYLADHQLKNYRRYYIAPETDALYVGHTLRLVRLDIETGDVVFNRHIEDRDHRHDIFMITEFDSTNTHFFACDMRRPHLYVLNKQSWEIEQTYRLGEAGVSLGDPPLVANGRVYVLDLDNRLHVFEQAG